ncbi:hypothetical protein N9L92_03210 [Saprospiraceae bacterium]|nr:hypothetical protein [Saprospiraceae bacterium]
MNKTIVILTLLLSAISCNIMGQGPALSSIADVNNILPFKIEISENNENHVVLTCNVCSWTDLSFTLNGLESQTFDANGMVEKGEESRNVDEKYPDFLISIIRNGNHFRLTSERGTAWKDVDFMMSCNNRNLLNHEGIALLH